jgi:hypothetical protein
MRLLEAISKLSHGAGHKVVSCVAQGDHGTVPPFGPIKSMVERWVNVILPFAEKTNFEVQVECRRDKCAKLFVGVKAIRIPMYNRASVELRVRPPEGGHYQWICHLICPSEVTAFQIISAARPTACEYLLQEGEKVEKIQHSPSKKLVPTSRLEQGKQAALVEQRSQERLIQALGKNAFLRKLCAVMATAMDGSGRLGMAQIGQALNATFERPFSAESLRIVSALLVEEGLLDPNNRKDASSTFTATILFDEYLEEYNDKKKGELRESLILRKASIEKLFAVNKREQERLAEVLDDLRKSAKKLEAQIAVTTIELEEL